MCHSLFFGLILGYLAAKLVFRYRIARCGGHRFGPGSWAGHCADRFSRHAAGFQAIAEELRKQEAANNQGKANQGPGFVDSLFAALDLNARQKAEAEPVLKSLREQIGDRGPRVRAALREVANDSFDRQRILDLVAGGPQEAATTLADGLEHLHNILIPEQRETLRDGLSRGTF